MNESPKTGSKLRDTASGAEAIVIRPPAAAAVLQFGAGGGVLLGKRYRCSSCDAEVLVTKGGSSGLSCHDTPMHVAQPKTLPSSD